MSKGAKIWLIVAASLILIGGIIFVGVMTMLKWDFAKLSTNPYETNEYEMDEAFKAISVDIDTADITFISSENSKCSVVCYEQKNLKHSVTVKDDTLVIETVDTRKWYEHIGITFDTPKITVAIPEGEYGALSVRSSTGDVEISKDFKFESMDLSTSTGDVKNAASAAEAIKIKTSTGNIGIEGIAAGSLDLSVSTGRVNVSGVACEGDVSVVVSTGKAYLVDVACQNLSSSGNTGDISLKQVVAEERFSIERSTGDVKFEGCDAAEIFVEADTGDVKGSLLTDKVFITQTDTGRVDVPKSITGGRCEITTNTGNIQITIRP